MYESYLIIKTGGTERASMPIFISSDKNAKVFHEGMKSLYDMKVKPFTYKSENFSEEDRLSIDKFISLWHGEEMSALELGFKALLFSTTGTDFCDWSDSNNSFDISMRGEDTDKRIEINLLSNIPDDQLHVATVKILNRLNRPIVNHSMIAAYYLQDIEKVAREDSKMGRDATNFVKEIKRIANKRSMLWGDDRESSVHATAARYGLYLGMARLMNENITKDIFETIILQVMSSGYGRIPDFWWTGTVPIL